MRRRTHSQFARTILVCCLTLGAMLAVHITVLADESPHAVDPPPRPPQVDLRTGGVLAESYSYHSQGVVPNQAPPPNIAPEGGWYGYGFPVQTYRWGWFGAERYYPRVVWHRGYYGDCCRWAYRYGY